MSRSWYVVVAKQNHDALVLRGLREQGYETYSPKTFTRESVKGKMRTVSRRRLSPYVLVQFDVSKGESSPIKNTRGVEAIVPKGRDPEPLRHGADVVAWLRQIEDEEFSESDKGEKKGRDDIEVGQRVKIVSGERKNAIGIEGLIAHIQRGKVDIFVGNMLIRDVPDVDLETLEPLKHRAINAPKKDKKPKKDRRGR